MDDINLTLKAIKMKKLIVFVVLALIGCSSTELVENWKNPDIVIFDASKVLIVGMTQNADARKDFESNLHKEFKRRGIESMRSMDLFDVKFTDSKKTEKELDAVEEQLLDKDFDAILLTKITGSENREVFRKKLSDWTNYDNTFREDYLGNQSIYYDEGYYDKYTVYNAETSLYCICVDKKRQLIWRGSIDIIDPINIHKSVSDYVKLVVSAMEEQDLIFRKDKDEITGI
jgi:Skp family chaperone for outer membrane proteins